MIQYHQFAVNPIQENSYLLWDETKQACVIDPGFSSPEETAQLDHFITEHGLTLTRCLHTHLHFDHLWGAPHIMEKYRVVPEASQVDIDDLPHLMQGLIESGSPFAQKILSIPFRALPETDAVAFGESTFRILHVPGHTRGHVAYYSPEDTLVATGDVLFEGGDMGRADLWGGDYRQLITSIRTQLFTLPGETRVLTGHGATTTIEHERTHFMYD